VQGPLAAPRRGDRATEGSTVFREPRKYWGKGQNATELCIGGRPWEQAAALHLSGTAENWPGACRYWRRDYRKKKTGGTIESNSV